VFAIVPALPNRVTVVAVLQSVEGASAG